MNTEAEINLLRDRVRELEKSVEQLEKSPFQRSPRDRMYAVLTGICLWFGVMAFFGFGIGLKGSPFHFDANHITTQSVTLENPDDAEESWGKIDGKRATIKLDGVDGSVEIDPTGIRLEGPDGVLILKPEKK